MELDKLKESLPKEWSFEPFSSLCKTFTKQTGFDYSNHIKPTLIQQRDKRSIPFIQNKDFDGTNINFSTDYYIPKDVAVRFPMILLDERCFLISISGSIGKVGVFNNAETAFIGGAVGVAKFKRKEYLDWVMYYLKSNIGQNELLGKVKAGSHQNLILEDIRNIQIPLPPLPEQKAIAQVLSDTDNLIQAIVKKLAKKRAIKQGAMQQLLTPKEDWEVKTLGDTCDVLDNLRVPLNSEQRLKMKGDIPYCGANGIVDYVNDYIVDDEIILMAEDGGYFDEYKTRPIAYLMKGKCWVNNHAHILKAKTTYFQDFIFYSIVHKNILDYINGGTRAKLNKSDLVSIEINVPSSKEQQVQIATILSDMDAEIEQLKEKLSKYKMVKQGLMQNLLTGKIRLV